MPGRHAPASPRSFYLSLSKAIGASLAAVGLMVLAVLVFFGGRGGSPAAFPTVSAPPTSPAPAATSPRPTPPPTVAARPPSQVSVALMNGTTRNGLAARERPKISAAGYPVVLVGNANPTAQSTVFYRPGWREEALAFQRAFPQFAVVAQSSQTGDAVLRVVFGADYPS